MRFVTPGIAMVLAISFVLAYVAFGSDNTMLLTVLLGVVFLATVVVRGVASRPLPDRRRVLVLAFGAVALLAAAPWVAPIFPGLLGDLMVWALVIPVFFAVYLMARTLSRGLAIGASILLVIALTWATGWSAMLAYETGWQGLDIRDVSGIDQGDGFGIGLAIIIYTFGSPIIGSAIGLLSQVGKRPSAPSAVASGRR